jgi:hypothetical protein
MKIFTNIKSDNRTQQIEEFIDELFTNLPYDVASISNAVELPHSISGKQFVRRIMESISGDFTIIYEDYHIDKSYRDSYYMYFSNQHFQVERYCKRLTFLTGYYTWDNFLGKKTDDEIIQIENSLVGICVIKPISSGIIGRSLLNPKFFVSPKTVYIRKSKYKINIYGIALEIEAFPYQMQDRETMRCSEVTLLNLMDYYSNTYKDYKSVMPSEIIDSEQRHSHERVLPSRGVTYHVLTKVLSDFGFAPRLYNLTAIKYDDMSGISQGDELKRLLHYYVESGIPVAVNVEPESGKGIGHSLICIGHSASMSFDKANERKKKVGDDFNGKYSIINSADFYDSYVVIDDNQFPYEVRKFDRMSIYPNMHISNIAVPLYRRMFLEAADAYEIALMILESDKWGVFKWSKEYLGDEMDIVIRLFLASSRTFKKTRVEAFGNKSLELQMYYAMVRMPQFVWVCEIYTNEGYGKKCAFGEMVLDGTSALKKGIKNLILLNYPARLYARNPDQSEKDIDENTVEIEQWCEIEAFRNNLKLI